MPILPLPEEDARKLGATLSITTPVVLVKELLDNALDAGATTVVVLVSPNTIDRIEVRDNGHGISPGDFDALGRAGYTSKLQSLSELATVGARSLGFRGVALASINTLAEVTITTRTASEPVAEVLRLVAGGGTTVLGRKGNPVGTAVCVDNLFAKFPVRQRSAIGEAPKTITKIKELLHSYAFARVHIKLAFRVLGKEASTWCYRGKAGCGVKEAASQVFGHEAALHCSVRTYPTPSEEAEGGDRGSGPNHSLSFEGLLPHRGGNPQKLIGAFFSVNSRPLLSSRGVGKKLFSIFKTHYSQSLSTEEIGDKTRGILIWLNIICPPGSYDVNIEPAKDDVLFDSEEQLIDHFKRFLLSVYPKHDNAYSAMGVGLGTPPASHPVNQKSTMLPQIPDHPWAVDMSGAADDASDDDDDNDGYGTDKQAPTRFVKQPHAKDLPFLGDNAGSPFEPLTPWSIAALAASRRPKVSQISKPTAEVQRSRSRTPSISQEMSDSASDSDREPRGRSLLPGHHPPRAERSPHRPAVRVPGGPYRRPLPAANTSVTRKPRSAGFRDRGPSQGQWEASRSVPRGSRPQQRQAVPPDLGQTRLSFGDREMPQQPALEGRRYGQPSDSFGPRPPALPRVEQHYDLERSGGQQGYKLAEGHGKAHTQEDHQTWAIRGNTESRLTSVADPSEEAFMATGVQDPEPLEPVLPAEDKRAYLMKRQRSIARDPVKKYRRLRTDLLPLESIPNGAETQSLALVLEVDTSLLVRKLLSGEAPVELEPTNFDLKKDLEGGRLAPLEQNLSILLSHLGVGTSRFELKPPGPLREQPSP